MSKRVLNEFFGLTPQIKNTNWNGVNIELGKVYSNPFARSFKPIEEATKEEIKKKKLRIFDFDDTLVKTKSFIYVKHKNGEKSKLSPGEYAVYDKKEGDEFDYSDFEKVNEPEEIKKYTNLLRKFIESTGKINVAILTARGAYQPVREYLKDIGMGDVYVAALGDSDPQKKADWIEDKIKKHKFNDIYFVDDSHKNVKAVGELKTKYPDVTFKIQHVKHNGKYWADRKEDSKDTGDSNQVAATEKPKSISTPDWETFKNKSTKEKKDILDKTIKNTETGRNIKLRTALNYDDKKAVYKAAVRYLKTQK